MAAAELNHLVNGAGTSTDDLPAVGVGVWTHRVGGERLFVYDLLLGAGTGCIGTGLGHLESLLALRHMVARADRGKQVDDKGKDVEGKNEGDDWKALEPLFLIVRNWTWKRHNIPHSSTAEVFLLCG